MYRFHKDALNYDLKPSQIFFSIIFKDHKKRSYNSKSAPYFSSLKREFFKTNPTLRTTKTDTYFQVSFCM